MDSIKNSCFRWLNYQDVPAYLRDELQACSGDDAALTDRFWRDLEFGTGGLRGIIGAGTNRMNIYTVGKATQGLANFLIGSGKNPSAVIAYDTRNMSREFAERAACILCANGVKTHLFDGVRPTPMLSFAVRYLNASAGIVITASHNPREYNGYKVYGPDGGQITDHIAAKILTEINACDIFADIKTMDMQAAKSRGLLQMIGENVDKPYYEKVKALALRRRLLLEHAHTLRILYSPLHGAGNLPVRRVLRELGFSQINVVPEQESPDGDFPTVPYPNPEEPEVFELAKQHAGHTNPDLIFATDPDGDRIGVLIRDDLGEYCVLSGNQIGALLCDYILAAHVELGTMPDNGAVIKTIVTTDIAHSICSRYGATLVNTLTGFKYIGEKIGEWEQSGQYSFLFGFEESNGCLAGDFVRDKDAVIAAALIAEMTLYYKLKGQTLFGALQTLYARFGYYSEKLVSRTIPGREGQQKITAFMAALRENHAALLRRQSLAVFEDYKKSVRILLASGKREAIALPESDTLKFILEDGSWLVFRPSGTEPKIKVYLSAVGADAAATDSRIQELEALVRTFLEC